MIGKEFLWQYIMIDRQIRSVKFQLDSMTEIAKENAMSSVFQNEITDLKNELKNLILESAAVKRCIWFCQYHLTHFIRTRIMQRERYDHSRAFFGLPEADHRWRCRFFCWPSNS